MMNTDKLLKIQAYLDNELPSQESRQVSEWLANDAEAQAILQELRETKAWLAGNEMAKAVPETREFYWSKIEREIQRVAPNGVREPLPTVFPAWVRWAIPFAGAVMILLILSVLKPFATSRAQASYFHEIETPLQEANAISFHSQAAGLTVVWIDSGGSAGE